MTIPDQNCQSVVDKHWKFMTTFNQLETRHNPINIKDYGSISPPQAETLHC